MTKYHFTVKILFQYIKCGGSAIYDSNRIPAWSKFQYIKCGGSADLVKVKQMKHVIFQYIKCGGSA